MTPTFAALGVPAELCEVLAKQGINEPFPIQQQTITDALAGRDVCGKAKTGSGKTLAFCLPTLAHTKQSKNGKPTTLILTPTRELTNQVGEVIQPLAQALNLRCVIVYGGAGFTQQTNQLRAGAEIIVATPGRLIDLIDRQIVDISEVKRVVIDEADRMGDMGFLPQTEWLLRHIQKPHQTLLFSATLDGAIDVLVKRHLNNPSFHEVVEQEVTVAQMSHLFLLVHQMDRVRVAARITAAAERTLIFASTRHGATKLSAKLQDEGVNVRSIRGDMPQHKRLAALKAFATGEADALVATDVASRGLHIEDVDVVMHYDVPLDAKTYLHRSGRTARAGKKGVAVTLFMWDEELEVRKLQRRLELKLPLEEVFSSDPRLDDVAAWATGDLKPEPVGAHA